MSNTATQNRQNGKTQPPQGGEGAVFQEPRLPYHPAIQERFDVDKTGWNALTNAIYPAAKTTDAVTMVLSYCAARNLDPFKRPVHIVPMWSREANEGKGGYVETVWPGIAELRTTASRTGQYAGCEEALFGEEVTKTFTGRIKDRRDMWVDEEVTVTFPRWCQITVLRLIGNRVCRFVGPKVYWLETYATIGKTELPNDMWQRRTIGQLEKCAEAAALRKAFPEELGNELTAEEMHGQRFIDGEVIARDNAAAAASDIPPAPPVTNGRDKAPDKKADISAERNVAESENPAPPQEDSPQQGRTFERAKDGPDREGATDIEPEEPGEPINPDDFLDDLEARCAGIKSDDPQSFGELRQEVEDTLEKYLPFPPDRDRARDIINKHAKRFEA